MSLLVSMQSLWCLLSAMTSQLGRKPKISTLIHRSLCMTMEGSQKSALSGDVSVSMQTGANTSLTWVSWARNGFECALVSKPTKDTGLYPEVEGICEQSSHNRKGKV